MDPTSYIPSPINIEKIQLPREFVHLTERLAENAHELWARQRVRDGWRYGPMRDDAAKFHPCLLPYDQLPESEKEYDRIAVVGVLKAMLALGCRITTPSRGEISDR